MKAGREQKLDKRVALLVSEWSYFRLHWLPLVKQACKAGGELTLLTRTDGEELPDLPKGLEVQHLDYRRGVSPLRDLLLAIRLIFILRKLKPDLVQFVSLKAALLGTLPALLARVPRIVNVIPGLGYVFTSKTWKARLLARLARPLFKWTVNRRRAFTVAQNRDDRDFMRGLAKPPDRVILIPGVGVNLGKFPASPEPGGSDYRVILPARLLWSKGVGEFVQAARDLRAQGTEVRMTLVGAPDPGNPETIDEAQVKAWAEEGVIEDWGQREDMAEVYRKAHIVCLPTSYGEGLPTVLLEAAASGRAIIATDIPGCRQVIHHGENGMLVPPGDAKALAEAIQSLVGDRQARRRYGRHARKTAELGYNERRVHAAYLALFSIDAEPPPKAAKESKDKS